MPEDAHSGRVALVERLRALLDAVVVHDAPADVVARATEEIGRAVDLLRPFVPVPRPSRYPGTGNPSNPGTFMPFDPMVGALSPLAPPIRVTCEDGRAVGRVCFGPPYEGPPGCVHGGVIAAAFDQVFNVANVCAGSAGPTVQLLLRYRRPTPLQADLVFEGWQERTEGQRIHTRGRLRHGEQVTVEAEGVFVQLPVERVMRLLDRR
jgi:acyl-coenzyme A thioesterase PaaI-like protein